MFENLGIGELMVILVIVLVLFGAKRVPEISASFGKGIREFKRNMNGLDEPAEAPLRTVSAATESNSVAWQPHEPESVSEPKRLL